MERRKRHTIPKSLLVFGIIFLVMPIINYYSISVQTGIGFLHFQKVFSQINLVEAILLFASIPVGVGLLLVKRWGWWLFFIYSLSLIAYNLFLLVLSKDLFDLGVLLRTILGTLVVIYFSRKDISAPYFKMYPRGWRFQKRKPVVLDVIVNNKTYKTKDISVGGLYIESTELDFELNSGIAITLKTPEKHLELKAGVVRIDSQGIGLAFRNLSKEDLKMLDKIE